MDRSRPRVLMLVGAIVAIFGVVLRAVTRQPKPRQGAVSKESVAPPSAAVRQTVSPPPTGTSMDAGTISDASPPSRDGLAGDKDERVARSSATRATEDAVSRRPMRSGGQGFVFQQPPSLAERSQASEPSLPSTRSHQVQRSRLRPHALMLVGVTCVILGAALYAGARLALPSQSAADLTDTTTMSDIDAPTPPNATSPVTEAADTTPDATSPAVTLTTIAPAALPGRLKQIASNVGFTILGLKAAGWKLAAVDSQTEAGEPFAAVNYTRGGDYVTITQQKTATPPTLPGAQPTTIRGQAGALALMNPVVLLRWQEQGVAILLTTSLPEDAALALAGRLEPVP